MQWRLITRDSLKVQMDGPSVPSFSIISRYPYIPLDLCATHGFNLLLPAFPPTHSLLLTGLALKRAELRFEAQINLWPEDGKFIYGKMYSK